MASDLPTCDDKKDPIKIDSEESPIGSSVDGESGEPGEGEGEGGQANPTPEQAPKRKGGRKPIYATTEERKQRNRQAQAAFRERRTEYIKQLESTISIQEHSLNNLNAAHRTAMDECLMLRYKNSLLERILLEKSIDVQAELQAKHGSPNFGPTHMPAMIQPPIPRALLNRHGSRRSTSSIASKVENSYSLPPIQAGHLPTGSPKARATAASPTTTEGFGPSPAPSDNTPSAMRPGMPPISIKQPGHPMGQMSNPSRMMPPMPPQMGQQQAGQGLGPRMGGGGGSNAAPFYQTPQYQSHLEQLGKLVGPGQQRFGSFMNPDLTRAEHEYDAAADLMDEQQEQPEPAEGQAGGPGPYPGSAYAAHAAQQHQQHQQQMSPTSVTAAEVTGQQQQQGMSIAGIYDPGTMDFDPFGLSASMAFPNPQFSFDTSNMR